MNRTGCAALLLLLGMISGPAANSTPGMNAGALRAAAIKVDITPTDPHGLRSVYQTPFSGVHDKTYARGIILDNGVTSAAIISFDAVEVADEAANEMIRRISEQTGIPSSNIILTATHDHSAPMIGLHNWDSTSSAGPAASSFLSKVESDVVAETKRAKENAVPARLGIGRGNSYININRDLPTPAGTYTLGRNPNGPSDKTLWVIKIETLSGEPIAFMINYAVHGTVLDPSTSLTSGDLQGAASRYVEDQYKGKVVAMWTMGAAGDQEPVASDPDPGHPNSEKNFAVVDVLGQIIGNDVIWLADRVVYGDLKPKIAGIDKVVTCPGQKVVKNSQSGEKTMVSANPVTFHLGLLMIDKIAITTVSAEVVTNIYQRLRDKSPFSNIVMISIANGRIGYIPQDSSYKNPTFEVYGSPLAMGCGESAIVDNLLEMMKQY